MRTTEEIALSYLDVSRELGDIEYRKNKIIGMMGMLDAEYKAAKDAEDNAARDKLNIESVEAEKNGAI